MTERSRLARWPCPIGATLALGNLSTKARTNSNRVFGWVLQLGVRGVATLAGCDIRLLRCSSDIGQTHRSRFGAALLLRRHNRDWDRYLLASPSLEYRYVREDGYRGCSRQCSRDRNRRGCFHATRCLGSAYAS